MTPTRDPLLIRLACAASLVAQVAALALAAAVVAASVLWRCACQPSDEDLALPAATLAGAMLHFEPSPFKGQIGQG